MTTIRVEADMAKQKVDDREVRKIRTAIAMDGEKKATARFDENSPEFQKAQRDRHKRRASARTYQRSLRGVDRQPKGKAMSNEKKQSPAQQRAAGQGQGGEARQRAAAMKQRQAKQNVRIRQRNAKQQGQSQGQAM